jgi:hypothetical protein
MKCSFVKNGISCCGSFAKRNTFCIAHDPNSPTCVGLSLEGPCQVKVYAPGQFCEHHDPKKPNCAGYANIRKPNKRRCLRKAKSVGQFCPCHIGQKPLPLEDKVAELGELILELQEQVRALSIA